MAANSANHLPMVGLASSANRSPAQRVSSRENVIADPINRAWNSRRVVMGRSGG
jgi:hypothetical protein